MGGVGLSIVPRRESERKRSLKRKSKEITAEREEAVIGHQGTVRVAVEERVVKVGVVKVTLRRRGAVVLIREEMMNGGENAIGGVAAVGGGAMSSLMQGRVGRAKEPEVMAGGEVMAVGMTRAAVGGEVTRADAEMTIRRGAGGTSAKSGCMEVGYRFTVRERCLMRRRVSRRS